MTDGLTERHGLESRVRAWPTDNGVELSIRDDLGHLNLRGNPGDKTFRKAAESVLGQALPVEPNTISIGKQQVFWLGPDEWLVTGPATAMTPMVNELADAFAGIHAAVARSPRNGSPPPPLVRLQSRPKASRVCVEMPQIESLHLPSNLGGTLVDAVLLSRVLL